MQVFPQITKDHTIVKAFHNNDLRYMVSDMGPGLTHLTELYSIASVAA